MKPTKLIASRTKLLALATVVILGMGAAEARTAVRTLWIYEGGSFENKSGRTWVENTKDGDIQFVEITRNADFIEIYDNSRKISVRLYSTRMYWRTPTEGQWNFLHNGRWRD